MTPDNIDQFADKYAKLAWQAFREGDFGQTMVAIDNAIAHASGDLLRSAYLAAKGGFLRRFNRVEEAKSVLNDATQLVPRNVFALSELGLLSLQEEDYREAEKCFTTVVEATPSAASYTLLAASQLLANPSAARRNAEQALALDPDWEDAKVVRAAATESLAENGMT